MTAASQTPGEPAELDALIALAQREHRAGRLAEAATAYRQIVALRPDIPAAHNGLANVLLSQGKLAEAAAEYERALALKPGVFQAHNNLGCIFQMQGKFDRAVAHFERVIALRPDYAGAYNNLGCILSEQGQLDQARTRFEQALARKPDYAEAYNNLGNVLKEQGKLDQALARFEQALVLKPDYAEAYNSLGNVLKEQGKLDQALARYRQALALRPDLAEAHYNAGIVLMDLGKLDVAATAYERATALKPSLFRAHNNLGNVLWQQGKLDQALARYRQAIALAPDFAEAHYNLGNSLKDLGKFDEALASYDQTLTLKPDYAEVHYLRTDLKRFRNGDADLAALEALADADRLSPGKMAYIHFALGKALEDVGDYGRAFEHVLKGNALKRTDIVYDEAGCQRGFQFLAELFDASLFARFAAAGDPSSVPIFIVGMPRSGSTLVEQILASHPQVDAAGELKNLDRVANSVLDAGGRPVPFPQCISVLDADGLRRLGQAYLASLPTLPAGKTRITDKAPNNFLRVGLIRLILPNARIIHTLRDPVDTCVSCFSRLMPGLTYSYDLAELGRHYRWYHELMAHWRAVLPAGAMLDVTYENVVDDLEAQARRLIDYCGLPWDDRCLSFHETSRLIATPSNVQVRQPLYRSSVARRRRYEAYLQPLLAELEGCRQ